MSAAEFLESAVLVEVMDGDIDAAKARLRDEFLDNELDTFADQVSTLHDLIAAEARRRRVAKVR